MSGRVASADFETTTDERDCRVWAWAVCFVDEIDSVDFGTDVDSFLIYVASHGCSTYYFHNLAFDGRFLVDRMLRLGYAHTLERRPKKGEFATIVSGKGKFYQISVRFFSGVVVTFRDSLKLFPMSVARIARAFGLEEGKGELDYGERREVGHELTVEERDYIRKDVQIVAHALAFNMEQSLSKMTIGANAFSWYKDDLGQGRFKHLFPVLTHDMDAYIRLSYRGGFTWVEPRWRGRDVFVGISVDYNSMYPSMLVSKDYPVGEPFPFVGRYSDDPSYPLYVQSLTCSFALKPRGIPMVQLRNAGFYGQHEYVERTVEPVSLTLTSVDLALLFDNYDVDVLSWDGGVKFQSMPGDDLFGSYVSHWGEVKRNEVGGMRQLAKLMLNNLYLREVRDASRRHAQGSLARGR